MPPHAMMPSRALIRVSLAALSALSFLSPFESRADAPLASSGPYTLTQSLVDADADYLGWAAGRALAPAERQRLAALEMGRFRRDPAWTVKVLAGEQKTLPTFKTFSAPVQDRLRRTVLADIPNLHDDHLTPDEARQMQRIAAGISVPDAPAPVSVPAAAPASTGETKAAAPLPPLAEVRLPIHSGKYALTAAMVDDDVEIYRLALDKPLSAADKRTVAAVDADIFRRAPAWLVANARLCHKNLPALRRGDPVFRADLRRNNLVDIFCTPQKEHMSAEDAAQLQAMAGHYVPIVGVDAASGAVITGQDIDAWVAATRFITDKAHVPAPVPGYRASLVRIAREPSALGPQVEADAAAMERNWAAFHLVWPHLPDAQRAQALSVKLSAVKKAMARGQGLSTASSAALLLGQEQFGNYPAALDPRVAMMKRFMMFRMMQFQGNMMNYNIQTMMQGNVNNARIINGQGIDLSDPKNNIPLPVP